MIIFLNLWLKLPEIVLYEYFQNIAKQTNDQFHA